MRLLAPARRVNMGTADEFALDILINALDTLSRECAPCARLFSTCPHAQTFAGAVQRSFCAVRCGAVQFLPTIESTCGLACREIRIRQLIIGGINSDWPVPVRVSQSAGSLTDMSTQCPAHHVTSYVRTYVTAGALKRGDTLRRRSRTWTGCCRGWTPRTSRRVVPACCPAPAYLCYLCYKRLWKQTVVHALPSAPAWGAGTPLKSHTRSPARAGQRPPLLYIVQRRVVAQRGAQRVRQHDLPHQHDHARGRRRRAEQLVRVHLRHHHLRAQPF